MLTTKSPLEISIGVWEGAGGTFPQISGKRIFRANFMKNSGILLIFMHIFSDKNVLPPLKLTELLRLWKYHKYKGPAHEKPHRQEQQWDE